MRDKNDLSMDFIVLTGMSGAGKSTALNVLEDMGYYCVDNIPSKLLPEFYTLCKDGKKNKVAVVIDVRDSDMPGSLLETLEALKAQRKAYRVLFLDSENKKLVNRYKETRRVHPLSSLSLSLNECVASERKTLYPISLLSDYIIDTSRLSPTQLKHRVKGLFAPAGKKGNSLIVSCVSFGFKYGMPPDADLVFDARCFPNPFYIPEIKNMTGLDKPVSDYVLNCKETQGFMARFLPFVDYLLPLYCEEGKSELVFAIGCTGGKHRSVTIAEELCKHINSQNYFAYTFHRDIDIKNK